MTYFRSFCINFLAIFLIVRFLPGIEVGMFQEVPNIGAVVLFAFLVAMFNASVFPVLFILDIAITVAKIAIITGVISFGAFIMAALLSLGVVVSNVFGAIFGGALIWGVAFLTNYFEWHRGAKTPR
jgi:uncharacterized membrane protein YvlD (DUF360 family)